MAVDISASTSGCIDIYPNCLRREQSGAITDSFNCLKGDETWDCCSQEKQKANDYGSFNIVSIFLWLRISVCQEMPSRCQFPASPSPIATEI